MSFAAAICSIVSEGIVPMRAVYFCLVRYSKRCQTYAVRFGFQASRSNSGAVLKVVESCREVIVDLPNGGLRLCRVYLERTKRVAWASLRTIIIFATATFLATAVTAHAGETVHKG